MPSWFRRRKWQTLQCSFLGNPMDREAWQATVHGVTKSWTRLSDWTHTHTINWVGYFESEVSVKHSNGESHMWLELWVWSSNRKSLGLRYRIRSHHKNDSQGHKSSKSSVRLVWYSRKVQLCLIGRQFLVNGGHQLCTGDNGLSIRPLPCFRPFSGLREARHP